MKKRILSTLTALALCLALLPIAALAVEAQNVSYIYYTWDGNSQTLSGPQTGTAATATVIDSSTTTWDDTTTAGWYVAQGDVTIGGRVTVTGDVHLILEDNCKLTVTGGIQVEYGKSLTIYGQSGGTGTLEASATNFNAAIGGNQNQNAGKVTIHGGTVTATVTATGNYGAGIGGGGGGSGGTIKIYGGTVTATGAISAAPIGGSRADAGTVNATGGMSGAGIGGGNDRDGGNITIYGGTVNATGGMSGAGIGGGDGGGGGYIYIRGGTVNATSSYGVGIGGGYGGDGGYINIYGGTVTATGNDGAGIGGGNRGDAGTFNTGRAGNAVIFASGSSAIQDMSGQGNWHGVFFLGSNPGTIYGDSVTPVEDFSIPSGKTLTIENGKKLTINQGVTLTNSGTLVLYGEDRLTGNATLTDSSGKYYIATPFPTLSADSQALTYNGTDQFNSFGFQLSPSGGVPDPVTIMGQTFTHAGTNNWTIERQEIKNVGSYEVKAVLGAFATLPCSVTVEPATLTVTGATVDKTYDGDTAATVTDVTFSGLQNNETLVLGKDYTATAVFDDANAGTDKPVTVTVTLSNTQKSNNYTFQSDANTYKANASIEKAPLTLTLTADPTALSGGGTVKLTLTGLPSDGKGTATVTCSDTAIQVTDNKDSTWTATLPNRTATYTFAAAYDDNYSVTGGTCTVTVNKPSYTVTVTADPTEGGSVTGGSSYESGSPVTLTATPAEGYRFVAWLEGDKQVSTDTEYQFTANSSRKLTARFEVIPVTGVTLDQAALNLPVGETGTLTATVQPSDALNQAVTWSSSNGNVATVEADSGDSTKATVTAVAAGTATITATTQDGQKTAACTVTVPRPQQPSPPVDDGGGDDYVTPSGPSSGSYQGWDRIETALDKLPDRGTLTVTMNGETTLPGTILDAIAGRNLSLQLNLDGASWVIQGTSLPTGSSFDDVDFGVETGTSGIPVDVVNAITGEKTTLQMTLAHSGDFGFSLTLKLELDKTLAGYWANLYYYNEGRGALEFQYAARIGGTGIATFLFDHASQYAVVIDSQSHAPEEQPEPDTLPFSDVAENAWYYEAVAYVYEKGLMDGTGTHTFSPGAATSRAMVATILWRMAGSPVVNDPMDFADVGQGQWYSEAIRWAASEKIVTGYDDGRFGTNDPITREQLAAMLYRYAQTMGYDVSVGEDTNILSYTDALTVSTYAVPAMQWACGAGILTGTGDGSTLSPQGRASRAETAAMLTRFCQAYVTQ